LYKKNIKIAFWIVKTSKTVPIFATETKTMRYENIENASHVAVTPFGDIGPDLDTG
jgi:hypothetical protein